VQRARSDIIISIDWFLVQKHQNSPQTLRRDSLVLVSIHLLNLSVHGEAIATKTITSVATKHVYGG
jgi:hypothetical protein